MRIFVKLSGSLVTLEIFTLSSDKSKRKRNIYFVDTVHKLIYRKLCKIQQILCHERHFIPN